jgi:transcriptional regulator with XRE-family HTH domain
MPEQSSSFAGRLRSAREAAGLSQYALAKRSGLSKQTLSKLEMGEREPSWVTVQLLAKSLNLECTAFVDPEITIPPETESSPRGRPPKQQPADGTEAKSKKPRSRGKGK